MEKIYPYAVARVRAIENSLFTNNDLDQMINETPDRIIAILQEHKYNTEVVERVEDFDLILKNEIEKLYKLVKELVPEEEFINLFICKNDFHNIKVMLKSTILNKENDEIFIDGGTIPLEKIKIAITDKNYDILPDVISKAINEAIAEYEKTNRASLIDIILDKYTYLYMAELAKTSQNNFVIDFVKKMCDIVNLKTFFRVRAIHGDFKEFSNAFVENGDISIRIYKEAFEYEEPITYLKSQSDFSMLEELENDISVLDIVSDNYLTEYISVAKYEALGIEPIVAYIYAKEIEIKNIRIILTGKINNINNDVIKRRLRNSYV